MTIGIGVFLVRRKWTAKPLAKSAMLVAAPILWVAIELSYGVSTTDGTWFSDNWKANLSIVYAEYAVGLFIGLVWVVPCLSNPVSAALRKQTGNVR